MNKFSLELLAQTDAVYAEEPLNIWKQQIAEMAADLNIGVVGGTPLEQIQYPTGQTGINISGLPKDKIVIDQNFRHTAGADDQTSLVWGDKGKLMYRDLRIDQAVQLTYEEVAYYLQNDKLPTAEETKAYCDEMREQATLSDKVLNLINDWNPEAETSMATLQGIMPHLGTQDNPVAAMVKVPMVVALMNQKQQGKEVTLSSYSENLPDNEPYSIVKDFYLTAFPDKDVDEKLIHSLETDFILHMVHGAGNASTFTASVAAGTGASLDAVLGSAVGALSGPLHGGANEKALNNLKDLYAFVNHATSTVVDNHIELNNVDPILNPDGSLVAERTEVELKERVKAFVDTKLSLTGDQKKIPGIGHGVYKKKDPRAKELQASLEAYLKENEMTSANFTLAVILEEVAAENPKFQRLGLYPNVDFFSGTAFQEIHGIEPAMMTPVFAAGRTVGWSLRAMQQREDGLVRHAAGPYKGSIRGMDPEEFAKYLDEHHHQRSA